MMRDKNILITGGTGSFGKKFTEIMLKDHKLKKLIVFSRDEWKRLTRNWIITYCRRR